MDVHIVPGVKAKDVAEAHRKDILHEGEYDCKCMTYWIDEQRENIFCLIEAPDKDAVEKMHNRAHGLIPNKIIEVNSTLVESFLGRIYDPAEAEITDEGLKVFCDPSFRILLVTRMNDPVLLQHCLGTEQASALLDSHNAIIRRNVSMHGGREVEHSGNGFILSFASAAKAVSCALAIQQEMPVKDSEELGFSMCINGGEPVESGDDLFSDTIQKAAYMCTITTNARISLTSSVRELVSKDHFKNEKNTFLTLAPQDEKLLELLFSQLEQNWQDPEFDITDYCQAMAMSKSRLYRKTISLTGLSPNLLLKEFRLEKAKELLKKKGYNIAQITFDSGFTSPSYFTKCFKKKYGLLPMAYLELVR